METGLQETVEPGKNWDIEMICLKKHPLRAFVCRVYMFSPDGNQDKRHNDLQFSYIYRRVSVDF